MLLVHANEWLYMSWVGENINSDVIKTTAKKLTFLFHIFPKAQVGDLKQKNIQLPAVCIFRHSFPCSLVCLILFGVLEHEWSFSSMYTRGKNIFKKKQKTFFPWVYIGELHFSTILSPFWVKFWYSGNSEQLSWAGHELWTLRTGQKSGSAQFGL